MKSINNIVLIIICSLFLTTCIEGLETLKRDNPLDGKNSENNESNEKPEKGVALKFNSYTVYSDNNDDKIVNPGETIQIRVSLKNIGTSTANDVRATFATTSSHISGLLPTTQVQYGNISSNAVRWAQHNTIGGGFASEGSITYTIQFVVSNTTPIDTQIPININMVDESNNQWTDSFNVPVQ